MLDIIHQEPELLIPLLAIGGGFLVAICAMITCTIKKVHQSRSYEQSRREIAAYIAEGSMTTDEGERLLASKL